MDTEGIFDEIPHDVTFYSILETKIYLDDAAKKAEEEAQNGMGLEEEENMTVRDVRKYCKRFDAAASTPLEQEGMLSHLNTLRKTLEEYYETASDGSTMTLNPTEIVQLINLLAVQSDVDEVKAVVPSMGRFSDKAIGEVLNVVRTFRRNVSEVA